MEKFELLIDGEEAGFFPAGSAFLCSDHVTIADTACYGEALPIRAANLFDYAAFPKVDRWMDEMAKLPFHDVVHRYNTDLGDIQTRASTMERFDAATASAVAELKAQGVVVEPL